MKKKNFQQRNHEGIFYITLLVTEGKQTSCQKFFCKNNHLYQLHYSMMNTLMHQYFPSSNFMSIILQIVPLASILQYFSTKTKFYIPLYCFFPFFLSVVLSYSVGVIATCSDKLKRPNMAKTTDRLRFLLFPFCIFSTINQQPNMMSTHFSYCCCLCCYSNVMLYIAFLSTRNYLKYELPSSCSGTMPSFTYILSGSGNMSLHNAFSEAFFTCHS